MMKKLLTIVLLLCAVGMTAGDVNKLPLNTAEVILDLNKYSFKGEALTPYTSVRNGYYMEYSATGKLKGKARCQFSRTFKDLSCEGFDTLILSVKQDFRPQKVTLQAETDAGDFRRSETTPVIKGTYFYPTEILLDLHGAKNIRQISVVFESDKEGAGTWKSRWGFLALRNSRQFADYLKYWERYRELDWDQYLKSVKPQFKETANLTFAPGELDKFREFYLKDPANKNRLVSVMNSWKDRAKRFLAEPRAVLVRDSVQRLHDRKYFPYYPGYYLGLCGIILKDAEAIRLAAKCALALCCYESWNEYPQSRDWRFGTTAVFQDAGRAADLAKTIDFTGELFTAQGTNFVLTGLKRLGFDQVTWSLWGRDCFKGNQAAVFLRGKIMPLLLFAKYWRRIEPYTQIAMNELKENMDNIFRPDGGYLESTGYFIYTVSVAMPSYMAYTAARNLPLKDAVPPSLRNSWKFGEMIYSTSKNPGRNVISFGQTQSLTFNDPGGTLFMAMACPGTVWDRFVPGKLISGKLQNIFPYGHLIDVWRLQHQFKRSAARSLTPFIEIPSIGCVNSYRKTVSGGTSKVLLTGFAPMGKREEDIGKFIIEYDGDAFADAMTGRMAPFYATAEFQNMLVPTGPSIAVHPIAYTTLEHKGMKFLPQADGDSKSFKASIGNLAASWESKYFKKWVRSINSPNPENVVITDDYELGDAATGADFTWITSLPAEVKGGKVVITGDYGSRCELEWNEGCMATVERFTPSAPVYKGMFLDPKRPFSRIRIHRNGKTGKIEVNAKFIPQSQGEKK